MNAVTAYADSFVEIAQKYTPADGSLAEQFDRNTGAPLSAEDLTWSYAAFVTMAERRAGLVERLGLRDQVRRRRGRYDGPAPLGGTCLNTPAGLSTNYGMRF